MKRIISAILVGTLLATITVLPVMADDYEETDVATTIEETVEETTDEETEEAAEEVADEETEEAAEEVADEETEEVAEEVADEETEEVAEEEVVAEEVEIIASGNMVSVVVDGVEMELAAYNIAFNNYFKLRDVAAIISGSEKQFEVTWNEEDEVIEMVSGEAYTVVGGENETTEIEDAVAEVTTAGLVKDGEEAYAAAYEINDNNYFKLRDLGIMFDFDVSWDEETQTIIIDTTSSYTED